MQHLKTLAIIWIILSSALLAAEPSTITPDNLFEMSLEQLMDVPVAYSGSRSLQKISSTGVPISVITAEDIHYSGLTNIPDLLRFAPGVDMLGLTRNFYAIGVRGMHERWSDRTLVLINGRNAESPAFGGAEFYRYPILMDDIERIEIVRGPGGAAWGANAYSGVINIITKKPKDLPEWFASATVNHFGDVFNHLRWAKSAGDWSWKVSVGYNDAESSDDAGAGKLKFNPPVRPFLLDAPTWRARDFARFFVIDSQVDYRISDQTTFSFGVAASNRQQGASELGGFYPKQDARFDTQRLFARLEHQFDDDSSYHIQWSGNLADSNDPFTGRWITAQNDVETQYNFSWLENHHTSVGTNLRFTRIRTEAKRPEHFSFDHSVYNETLPGVFLIDRWTISPKWTLETQLRGDWYSETDKEVSTRVSALYTMDEQKDQVVRFSVARSFRNPLVVLREMEKVGVDLTPFGAPGLWGMNLIKPDKNLENEGIWSFETGYTQKLDKYTTFRADGYYQKMQDLIGYKQPTDPLFPFLNRLFYQAANLSDAEMIGGELMIEHRQEHFSVAPWYAYADLIMQKSDVQARCYAPAKNKAGLTCRLFPDKFWTINVNYSYMTKTEPLGPLFEPDMRHRLDLTVSRKIANGKGEWMVGVADVLNKTEGPNFGQGQAMAYDIPGRTFFARVQIYF